METAAGTLPVPTSDAGGGDVLVLPVLWKAMVSDGTAHIALGVHAGEVDANVKLTREQAVVKLDIDAEDAFPSAQELTRLLRRAGYRPVAIGTAISPSGQGCHIMIHVTPRPRCPFEVVALEALLGGDRNRCAMQMHRARAFPDVPRMMRDAWNVLYAPHLHRQRHLTLPKEGNS